MTTVRKIVALALIALFASCSDKTKTQNHFKNAGARYYENTKTDSTRYSFENISYNQLCEELYIRPYTPEESKLTGPSNSYNENISEFPNYSKEESERILKETQGKLYMDTTDRDFEKYWYNDKGLLEKYEIREFSDMIHNECIFSYDQNNLIKEIIINDIVTSSMKYKNRTIKIENNKLIIDLKHNIIK